LLGPLDVIWIHDDTIRPPGPKMVVCVHAELGLFFRINTKGHHQQSIPLPVGGHNFLAHDSHLECGEPLELDEFVVEEAVRGKGIIGNVSAALIPQIMQAVWAASWISEADKVAIGTFLGVEAKAAEEPNEA
jgi:hypothetical protein